MNAPTQSKKAKSSAPSEGATPGVPQPSQEERTNVPRGWRTGDTFIVSLVTRALDIAYAVTPFGLAEKALFRTAPASFLFVDVWVLFHIVLGAAAWLLLSPATWPNWQFLLLAYGVWRVLEICLYGMRLMLGAHKKIPTPNTVRSLRRSFLLALMNYAEVLFWFAALYRVLASNFGSNAEFVSTVTGSLYFSILTMATYGDITPKTTAAQWLVVAHLAISLYLTLGVLARFVSLLPRPKSLDDVEDSR